MDEEIKKLLLEDLDAARKNHEILKKLERALFWQRVFQITKWTLIIILVIIGFVQIQPYLGTLTNIYTNSWGLLNQIQNLSQDLPQELQNILMR